MPFSPDIDRDRGASGIVYGLLSWALLDTATHPKPTARLMGLDG